MRNYLLILILSTIASATRGYVVLVDPGHGGEEHGAIANVWEKKGSKKAMVNVYEKDLALELSKRVKLILQKKHTVYLTRSFDRTLPLDERSEMADKVMADLFVSIHFNSSTDPSSHGFETYYLDNHQDAAVKKVESLENKDLKGAEKVINEILIDLVIEKTVSSSKKLANSIHANLKSKIETNYGLKDRGIKPGLFYVLALSKRPGVLIEAGFMSNKEELDTLRKKSFLSKMAHAIADGINIYLESLPPKDLPLF